MLGALFDNDESPRGRVMRRGCRYRGGNCPFDDRSVDRFAAEVSHRAPVEHGLPLCFGGTEAKHVLLGRSHKRSRADALRIRRKRQPTHDRDRNTGEFRLHQLSRRRYFVGDRGHGYFEVSPIRIDLSSIVVEDGDAGGTDRDVDETVAPWSAHRVGDDDGDVDVELAA